MTCVVFTGPAGCGKSTAAAELVKAGYSLIKLAAPLKDMLRALYVAAGLTDEVITRKLEGDLKETPCSILSDRTPRHAMQTLGTEWRDMIGTNLWTDIWFERAMIERKVVCDDYRMPHETRVMQDMNALIIRIKRDSVDPLADAHFSEKQYDELVYHAIIENNGSRESFISEIHSLIKIRELSEST